MLSRLSLGLIYFYQRALSPRKGYRCAYSVLHGGTGCSGFAKFAIRDHGVLRALPKIRTRFADCRRASETLHKGRDPKKKRKLGRFGVADCCAGFGAGSSNSGSSAPATLSDAASSSDCAAPNPCDCTDFGGCSCDGCSCG